MTECTFGYLRDLLLGLGFHMQSVAGPSLLFELRGAGIRLVMEPFEEADLVDRSTLAIVRRNLDERGVMPRSRFDELLQKRSLVG